MNLYLMNRIFRNILATGIATIIFLPSYARQLSLADALARATDFRNGIVTQSTDSRTAENKLIMTETDGDLATLYVFEGKGSEGFLIVAADDAAGQALLGYSDTGKFPSDYEMPDNLKWWLGQYSAEIAMAAKGLTTSVNAEDSGETTARSEIEPLVKTLWGQLSPYNEMCPEINGTHCPTGCVATAMAQIMKYHNWPEKGVGSHTYTPIAIKESLTVDFTNTTYLWDKMLDRYASESAQESKDAVASLMYSCGVSVSMQYEASASGANYQSAAKSLVNYFDYDKGIRVLNRDSYGYDEWVEIVYNELSQGRPVMYSGTNDEGSHAFVCDGYRGDDYFHINWGWSGLSDGYFLLTALEPSEQGTGGSSAGYNLGQELILGIQPSQADSYVIPVIRFISNFSTSAKSYSRPYAEVKFMDRRGIFNESIGEIEATMGVKLTDGSGNVSYAESTKKTYLSGQGFINYPIPVESFPTEGTYTVTPAVKDQNGKWWDCEVNMANERSLILTVKPDSLVFSHTSEPTVKATGLELLSDIYPGKQFGLRALLTNTSDIEFYDDVVPVVVANEQEKGQATSIAVDLQGGDSSEFEWVGEFPSTLLPGDYTLYLVDSKGMDLNSGLPVTVRETPTDATQYTVVSSNAEGVAGTEKSPVYLNAENVIVKVTVTCESGYFSGIMQGGVFHADGVGIYAIPGGFIGVAADETKSITMNYDLSPYLASGNLYYFMAACDPYGRIGNKMYFQVGTQGLEMIGEESETLAVYRIPGTDVAEVTAPSGITSVGIYSASGGFLGNIACDGSVMTQIDVSAMRRGLYLIRVTMIDGTTGVVKYISL